MKNFWFALVFVCALAGCAVPPNGSTVSYTGYNTQDSYRWYTACLQAGHEAESAEFAGCMEQKARADGWTGYSSAGGPSSSSAGSTYPSTNGGTRNYGSGCQSPNYYGSISCVTGLPRTQYVSGYFRKDGTYVRPYYRSKR